MSLRAGKSRSVMLSYIFHTSLSFALVCTNDSKLIKEMGNAQFEGNSI